MNDGANNNGIIKAIDKSSVHRLCSGQVVLTLATAVKELIENSLDAGAKNISVRFIKSGLDLIEVSDDGSGVEEENFQALTLKHYTSKISKFSDLSEVETFGFRGEALSSLCALSKVTIVTRPISRQVGTKLLLDSSGAIVSQSPCPRQQGTTVTVQNLFSTLPVRRKELEKNISREFNRMVNCISGYCLLSVGVKLTLTNLTKNNGSSTTVLQVSGNSTVKGNIIDVFGVKQWNSLVEFVSIDPDEDVLDELGVPEAEKKNSAAFSRDISISGYASSAEHGQGRSSSDRQFLFINQRPFDSSKITRLVNDVYHSFNKNQYPFILLDIRLTKSHVDVNVTPDKRQVFLQNEKLLLAVIKTSLKKMYSLTPSLCISISASAEKGQKSSRNEKISSNSQTEVPVLNNKKRNFMDAFSMPSPSSSSPSQSSITLSDFGLENIQKKQKTLDVFASPASSLASKKLSQLSSSQSLSFPSSQASDESLLTTRPDEDGSLNCPNNVDPWNLKLSDNDEDDNDVKKKDEKSQNGGGFSKMISCKNDNDNNKSSDIDSTKKVELAGSKIYFQSPETAQPVPVSSSSIVSQPQPPKVLQSKPQLTSFDKKKPKRIKRRDKDDADSSEDDDDDSGDSELISQRKTVVIQFSLSKLKEKLKIKDASLNCGKLKATERRFRAQIQPGDNEKAESELRRMISKDMFGRMEILGQFNLGFLITKLDGDLFIVDQHATDEKYNFENLQRTVVLNNQKLIRPLRLELTASNESVLIENLKIFQKNGFDFLIDEEANTTERVKLTSIPTSRNWTFGQQDVEEMIFMLTESPGVMCRPSRIRQMLASRACRSSVMIGTALNVSEMKKLVRHMGEIEQPWNCPHGRPTIRHLINLDMIDV